MRLYHLYLISATLLCAVFAGCSTEDPNASTHFDNQLYISAEAKTDNILLKNKVTELSRTIHCAVPKPAQEKVVIAYRDDLSLVATYNESFYDEAIALPAENYELSAREATIQAGNVSSSEITVNFKSLNLLSRDKIYVLPVTIASANMDILQSSRTLYYVLKGAASINVVADMKGSNYISIANFVADKGTVCNGLRQFTLEALIRVAKFPAGIQTVMGIEDYFLLRISDQGLKPNQLQFANPYTNITNDKCMLTENTWTHVAATYDMDARKLALYINGELVSEETIRPSSTPAPADLGKNHIKGTFKYPFCIGFSYEKGREMNGEFSECRIWNVVRTKAEIAENFYEVDPKTPGLVAYWKFDEGKGQIIHDRTGNGNDGEAAQAVTWTPVKLPAPVE